MKKVIILLLLIVCISEIYAGPAISVGVVNDNLADLPGIPLDTMFGGGDDRYTYAIFANYNEDRWKILLQYQSITFRAEGTRYDRLSLIYIHTFEFGDFTFSLGGGLEANGDFCSDVLQNSLHRLTGVPEVSLQYLPYEVGLLFAAGIDYNYLNLFDKKLQFYVETDVQLTAVSNPQVLTFELPLKYKSDFFSAGLSGGMNIKYSILNKDLSGNSLFYRTVFTLKLPLGIILNAGFSRNYFICSPFNDTFTQYNWHTGVYNKGLPVLEIPEFYFCIGLGGEGLSLNDIPLP